jgi:hypothetical protein
VTDGDGERRLADTAGADDGHEAGRVEPRRDLFDLDLAVDHRKARRQIGMLESHSCNRSRLLFGRARNRGCEGIASSRRVDDVAAAVVSIAQRFAQIRHVKSQAAFLDGESRPDLAQ